MTPRVSDEQWREGNDEIMRCTMQPSDVIPGEMMIRDMERGAWLWFARHGYRLLLDNEDQRKQIGALGIDNENLEGEIRDARTALAEAQAEIARLRKDQSGWRKGVGLIASGLGEVSPADLSCVRINEIALALRAERDTLAERVKELEAR